MENFNLWMRVTTSLIDKSLDGFPMLLTAYFTLSFTSSFFLQLLHLGTSFKHLFFISQLPALWSSMEWIWNYPWHLLPIPFPVMVHSSWYLSFIFSICNMFPGTKKALAIWTWCDNLAWGQLSFGAYLWLISWCLLLTNQHFPEHKYAFSESDVEWSHSGCNDLELSATAHIFVISASPAWEPIHQIDIKLDLGQFPFLFPPLLQFPLIEWKKVNFSLSDLAMPLIYSLRALHRSVPKTNGLQCSLAQLLLMPQTEDLELKNSLIGSVPDKVPAVFFNSHGTMNEYNIFDHKIRPAAIVVVFVLLVVYCLCWFCLLFW